MPDADWVTLSPKQDTKNRGDKHSRIQNRIIWRFSLILKLQRNNNFESFKKNLIPLSLESLSGLNLTR